MQLHRQHIIITGGSSGIGRAVAKQLAVRGAYISLIARNPARLEAARLEVEVARIEPGQGVEAISADVSVSGQVTQAVNTAITRFGPPAVLITCAGTARSGYFHELPLEIFEQTMATNYFGTLYSVRAVLPAMLKQRRGHLVLVSSGAGLVGLFGYTAYSPTKFAVRGLAESLRAELKLHGIGVSIVYPPDTETPQLTAEDRSKPPETKRITAQARVLSADQVARAIVRGLEKRTGLITPGLEMSLLARFPSLLLPGLYWYFDRLVARVRREQKSGV